MPTLSSFPRIGFDARWIGEHGIGRFSHEISQRIGFGCAFREGSPPASPLSAIHLRTWAKRSDIDGVFSPSYVPPVLIKKPFIFTIHDLNHIDVPHNSSPTKRLFYKSIIKPAVYRAERILTVSEFSKQRIIEWSDCPAEKIDVVYNGISDQFNLKAIAQESTTPYIFCCSNRKGHKNELKLLSAFSNSHSKRDFNLVFSGSSDEPTASHIRKLGLGEKAFFTGRLSESELAGWYKGAAVTIFPSLYEGFGLPLIESMAVGTPTIASSTSALPEVGGDASYYFDPGDIDSITEALDKVISDDSLRQNMRTRGLEQAKKFSWDQTAALVSKALTSLHC